MLKTLFEKYNLRLEEVENLQWNECGYSMNNGNIHRIGFCGLMLKQIPSEVFNYNNLVMLSIINNGISEISADISNLIQLKELYIGGNKIKRLPNEIGQLHQLEFLYIIEDDLVALPEELSNLTQLEELVLKSNYREEIERQIVSLNIKAKKIVINDEIFMY